MPDVKELGDIFSIIKEESSSKYSRTNSELWLCSSYLLHPTVRLTSTTEDIIRQNSFYGSDIHLDQNHFLHLFKRKDDMVLVSMMYKKIIGSRPLALLSQDIVDSFFNKV